MQIYDRICGQAKSREIQICNRIYGQAKSRGIRICDTREALCGEAGFCRVSRSCFWDRCSVSVQRWHTNLVRDFARVLDVSWWSRNCADERLDHLQVWWNFWSFWRFLLDFAVDMFLEEFSQLFHDWCCHGFAVKVVAYEESEAVSHKHDWTLAPCVVCVKRQEGSAVTWDSCSIGRIWAWTVWTLVLV